MMGINRIVYLLGRDRKGKLSFQEKIELTHWLAQPKNQRLYQKLQDRQKEDAAVKLLQSYNTESELKKIQQTLANKPSATRSKTNYWGFSTIAASILLCIAVAYYPYESPQQREQEQWNCNSKSETF